MHFTFDNPGGRVVFGPGTAASVGEELAALGRSRVLVVSTPGRLRSFPPIPADLVCATFAEPVQHVPIEVAERARIMAGESRADCILAIGGGSSIGVAKAIAIETALPIVAVPTTYGGSEMTSIWGITREGRKETGRDSRVRPTVVIYDPELTLDMPHGMTMSSGLNALAHCVEAVYAHDGNTLTAGAAMHGLLLLTDALPRLSVSLNDPVARATALEGSWLGGFALGTVSMGIQHKLAHTLGGSFGMPHAETHAALLPYTAAYNRDATTGIAEMLDADDAPTALLELSRSIGAPLSLEELGFRESDIARAASLAVERKYPNPRPVTEDDVRGLLNAAFAGDADYVVTRG
jgi:maleylacetate reductase